MIADTLGYIPSTPRIIFNVENDVMRVSPRKLIYILSYELQNMTFNEATNIILDMVD